MIAEISADEADPAILRDHRNLVITSNRRVIAQVNYRDHEISMITVIRWGERGWQQGPMGAGRPGAGAGCGALVCRVPGAGCGALVGWVPGAGCGALVGWALVGWVAGCWLVGQRVAEADQLG
jgi:hypothetical protein